MSQSATLYRISQNTFEQLNNSDKKQVFNINAAKDYITLQGTFMGLEFILSKGQDSPIPELVAEVFNPRQSIAGHEVGNLSEEQFELYENWDIVPYLDTTTISKLNSYLEKILEAEIHLKYDAKELNDNGIYPAVWHNDNSPDQAFNKRHILDDFEQLKSIINQAAKEQDYVLVFVG